MILNGRIFKYLLTENLPLELLLSADFSMINRELANYYGISGDFDDDFQRVVFQGDDLRKGEACSHMALF